MPTYHYRCKACDHEFEEFQSMADDPLTRCPSCRKMKLVRVISGSGLVFKGSGFYLTDYKKQGASAADSPGGTKPASGAEPGEAGSGSDGGNTDAKGGDAGTGKAAGPEGGKMPGPEGGKTPRKDGGKESGRDSGGKESGRRTGKGKPPPAPPTGDKA